MSRFIQNIIDRHYFGQNLVKPKLKSRFESNTLSSNLFSDETPFGNFLVADLNNPKPESTSPTPKKATKKVISLPEDGEKYPDTSQRGEKRPSIGRKEVIPERNSASIQSSEIPVSKSKLMPIQDLIKIKNPSGKIGTRNTKPSTEPPIISPEYKNDEDFNKDTEHHPSGLKGNFEIRREGKIKKQPGIKKIDIPKIEHSETINQNLHENYPKKESKIDIISQKAQKTGMKNQENEDLLDQLKQPEHQAIPMKKTPNKPLFHKYLYPINKSAKEDDKGISPNLTIDKQPQSGPTTIKVSIGQVVVNAVKTKPASVKRLSETPKPQVSLKDYLKISKT